MYSCRYCEKSYNKESTFKNHTQRCPENPERKIQTGRKGKPSWNKGLTKEDDPRIARPQFIGRRWGRAVTGHPEEFKIMMRAKAEERGLGGHTSKKQLYFKKKTGEVVYLQSSYEIRFAEILEELGIAWERPSPFIWVDKDGISHRYYPDFKIGSVYVDTKNDYLAVKDLDKITRVKDQNQIDLRIVTEKFINAEYIAELAQRQCNTFVKWRLGVQISYSAPKIMKKKTQEVGIIPMKCAVCTSCYRLADRLTDRCHFGGPYTGYTVIKDHAPVV